MKEQFPNHKIAFENVNNEIKFYNSIRSLLFVTDLKKSIDMAYQPELNYYFYLNKINDFLYFLPVIQEPQYGNFFYEKYDE